MLKLREKDSEFFKKKNYSRQLEMSVHGKFSNIQNAQ